MCSSDLMEHLQSLAKSTNHNIDYNHYSTSKNLPFKAGAVSKMEEFVTLDNISLQKIFSPMQIFQLFLQFTINEN